MNKRIDVVKRMISQCTDKAKLDRYIAELNELELDDVICSQCGCTNRESSYGYCHCDI